MSNLNFNYGSLQSLSTAQKTEFALSNVKQSGDDDVNLNQSIFKAYLETLKEKSDEATKKTLQQLQNTPISAVGRLFGDLQVNVNLLGTFNLNNLFAGYPGEPRSFEVI